MTAKGRFYVISPYRFTCSRIGKKWFANVSYPGKKLGKVEDAATRAPIGFPTLKALLAHLEYAFGRKPVAYCEKCSRLRMKEYM